MRKDGLRPENVRNIYHCHVHPDHIHADVFFQKRAEKFKDNLKIFYPKGDSHRFHPEFHLVQSNFQELQNTFGFTPYEGLSFTKILAGILLENFMGYEIPKNLTVLQDGQRISVGKRDAKFITTGGHTQGHSFLFFDDEDKILVNSDCGCINEFTSDWIKSVKAVHLAKTLKPHNLLGGHDPLKLGEKKTKDNIRGQFRRYDNMIKPFLLRAKPGKKVMISDSAYRRVGFLYKVPLVNMWAHMAVYCIFKYFVSQDLGSLSMDENGRMYFTITSNPTKYDFFEYLLQNYFDKNHNISICEQTLSYFH